MGVFLGNTSGNKLANEYDLYSGNLSRLENCETDPQFSTIWRTAEALGIKFSEFAGCLKINWVKILHLLTNNCDSH